MRPTVMMVILVLWTNVIHKLVNVLGPCSRWVRSNADNNGCTGGDACVAGECVVEKPFLVKIKQIPVTQRLVYLQGFNHIAVNSPLKQRARSVMMAHIAPVMTLVMLRVCVLEVSLLNCSAASGSCV